MKLTAYRNFFKWPITLRESPSAYGDFYYWLSGKIVKFLACAIANVCLAQKAEIRRQLPAGRSVIPISF